MVFVDKVREYHKGHDVEGKEDGIRDGRVLEHREMLINKIAKKLSKNKTIEQIADELEESESTIRELSQEIRVG